MDSSATPDADPKRLPPWYELVRERIARVRYGVIELIVHDGEVTQIETTEKTRVPRARS
jgi:hypothetical protein